MVVIVPTFNECKNIAHLIKKLQIQFQSILHRMHILVVDDNSPDGTAEIVNHCRSRYSNLHLIEGQKEGLGAAYIRGWVTH